MKRFINRFYRLFEKAYDRKMSATGLAMFRIAYGILLFVEVSEMRFFKELRFDPIPFIERAELNFGPVLFAWQVLIIALILGYKTKQITIANYLLGLLFFGCITSFEYHVFYAYMGLNFLLIFTPVSKNYSLDALIEKVKFTGVRQQYQSDEKVTVLYYYLPVYLGLGLVYFDSMFWKFDSHTWMSGLGMWRPASLPNFNWSGTSFILNNEFLSLSMGYVTLVFEFFFIFLFWYKRFRVPLLIIGMALHLGILIVFPIPLFALAACGIYILMVPGNWWKWIENKIKFSKPSITFIYDMDCPICTKTKASIESLDIFGSVGFVSAQVAKNEFEVLKNYSESDLINEIHSITAKNKVSKGVNTYILVLVHMIYTFPLALVLMFPPIKWLSKKIYGKIAASRIREECNEENCIVHVKEPVDEEKKLLSFISLRKIRIYKILAFFILFTCIQGITSLRSGIVDTALTSAGIYGTPFGDVIESTSDRVKAGGVLFLGINRHPVFNDGHYASYDAIFAVCHLSEEGEEWLPIIDKNGQAGRYDQGANWVNWTFRVNSPSYAKELFEPGIIRYSSFWAGKNNIDLMDTQFLIKKKKVSSSSEWEPNHFEKLQAVPWEDFAILSWKDEAPSYKYLKSLPSE